MCTRTEALIAVCAVITVPAVFLAGMGIGNRDAKLFQTHDKQRMTMLARSCGTSGTLMQDPNSDQFACIYRNQDGQAVMRYVTDAPTLIVRN